MARAIRALPFVGVAFVVLVLAKLHAEFIGEYDLTGSGRFLWTAAYVGLSCLIAYGLGIPDQEDPGDAIRSSLIAALAAPLGFGLLQLAAGEALIPRSVIAFSAPCYFGLFVATGAARRRSRGTEAGAAALLAVLDDAEASEFAADMDGPLERAAAVRAIKRPTDFAKAGDLQQALASAGATLLVLGRAGLDNSVLLADAARLHAEGLRVRGVFAFYEEWVGKIPHRQLGQAALMFDIAEVHRPGYRRSSRLLDVVFALLALAPLALVTPIVLIGNLFGNSGPLFYRQTRVGRNGTEFEMLKFRSMQTGEAEGEWTKTDDDRITRFGGILRTSHVDELPQVLNILKGDLSVVGPRPEQPRYVALLEEKIPFYQLRHLVRPGLTGWAQVNYPYGADERDALEKLQYEFWYLRHQSLVLDLRIIVRTLRHVLGFRGR